MANYTQDYTKAQNQYQLMQSMMGNAMQPLKRPGAATTLGKILTSYFASKGIGRANDAMDTAVAGRDLRSETDLASAMSAYRGDTPENDITTQYPGGSPVPGMMNRGTGQNTNAMAQALAGAHDPATRKMGMTSLMSGTKNADFTLGNTRYNADGTVLVKGDETTENVDKKKKLVFEQTSKLRDKFLSSTKDYAKVNDAYGRIKASASNPSPAGDMALIFNYMKMLDPGSVVRESEFQLAAASGSYGERIQVAYQKIVSGEKLSAKMRRDFVDRSQALFENANKLYKGRVQSFTEIADLFSLDPKGVIVNQTVADMTPMEMPREEIPPVTKVINGVSYQYIDGKWFEQ